MENQPSSLRARVQRLYTMTDELHVRLRVLEESPSAFVMRVKPVKRNNPDMSGDIETLVVLVMMEAAKSAQDDLKAIMKQVKAINKEKTAIRESLSEKQKLTALDFDSMLMIMMTAYAKQLDADSRDLLNPPQITKDALDSKNELAETEQLRLQMAMDRMSKMMSTLSNLMKKIADTQSAIVQNLK